MPFGQIQCADLSGWTGDAEAAGWRKVVASVAELIGRGAQARAAGLRRALRMTAAPIPCSPCCAFDNLSGDPEMAYFSDGVSEEILQTVARGADLKVIGRASSFPVPRRRQGRRASRPPR